MARKTTPLKSEVAAVEKKFPDNAVKYSAVATSGYQQEVASIRDHYRNDPDPGQLNRSGLGWMLPFNRAKTYREIEIANSPDRRIMWRHKKSEREKLKKFISAAHLDQRSRDDKLNQEYANYRMFEVTSDLLPGVFALGGFQSINLSADELPQIITPKARQHFNVRFTGQNGGARQEQWRTARSEERIEMLPISTDKVEYPLFDLQQGNVNEWDKINQQLRWDMEFRIDELALESLYANVIQSGLRDALNVHKSIQVDNIPDTNYLDLTNTSTYGTLGKLTLQRLKAILAHMLKWSFGIDPDGPASLATMVMSPLHATDPWDYVDLVSGWDSSGSFGEQVPSRTVPSSVRESIFNGGGMLTNAWGQSWRNEFNNRLPAGRIIVFTNQPVGWYFTKTEYDRIIEWKDDPDSIEQNIGKALYRKALNFYQPDLWAYRYLVVDFGSETLFE